MVFYCTLISMAVMHIRYAVVIELEEVTDLFLSLCQKKLEVQKLEKFNVSQNACNAVSGNLIFPLVTCASSLIWSVSMLDCTHHKKPWLWP